MWPTLVSIGPLSIHSFGVLLALGIFLGGFVFWQKAREEGVSEEELMDGWLVSGLASLLMARLWFVLTNWNQFNSWYRILFLTKFPGLAYEGAWFGFWLMLIIWTVRKKWLFWQILEAAVFAQLIVEIFGWLGSFLAGSNLGTVTSWWWGIGFPGVEGKRHPVHLIWILGLSLVFGLLKKWEKEYRSFGAHPGFLVGVYLTGLGVLQIATSFLTTRHIFLGVIFVVAGLLILLERWGKLKKLKTEENNVIIKQKKLKRKKLGSDFYVKN